MKIVIIGGVAGGATAAARLRRLNENDEIIILEKDQYISYSNCGLPYYIGDVIKDPQQLQVQTVKKMSKRFNLDIRVKNEVVSIDKNLKQITIKNIETNTFYTESFDKLILSCGASPIKPNIKGLEGLSNVFTLRNIPDTYRIKDYINEHAIKTVTVIGGGFIGVEMAENLSVLGLNVNLVEKLPQVLKLLDFEMSQIVHAELDFHHINLILNDGIKEFLNNGLTIKLDSGKIIDTQMTIIAIGVNPENTLAKAAGLKTGSKGHLITGDKFNTIDESSNEIQKDIYAIGDMIEVINFLDNTAYSVPLAWGANRQGRIVADHINGLKIKDSKIQGSSVIKVFDLIVATTGANEESLKQKGINYTAIHAHRSNHAGYYPNASNISLKIIFDEPSGKIYGAQAIGKEGTEKRIDVLSTVMRLGGTIYDLSDLELCYAPPFGSAKDPVNILGYIAENISAKVYKMVYAQKIDDIITQGGYLLDVRSAFEFASGHIKGSVNLDLDTLRDNLDKITVSKDSPIYVNCHVGIRSYYAIRILRAHGYTKLFNLSGGYSTYKNYKYALSNKNNVQKDQ